MNRKTRWSGPDMHYTPNELECNACGRKTQDDSFGSLCGVNKCRGTLRHYAPKVLTAEDIERIGKNATKNGSNINHPKRY